MKNIFKILIAFLLHLQLVVAQDIQLTQFYATPMLLNPAFTGINACSKFTLQYRNQWPGITDAYVTKLVTFDHAIKNSNFGIGVSFTSDEAGSGQLKTTLLRPVISYQARINRYSALRFGLQPGLGFKSINYDKLTFGDQIYRGGNVATVEKTPEKRNYFDLAFGSVYTYSDYWVGASVQHITAPMESFYFNPYNSLPLIYSVQMGGKFCLNKEELDNRQKKYISPVLHYRAQGKFDQFDIGFYLSKSIFNVGVWYRGIPGLKAYKKGYPNNDAVAILIGLQTNKIKIGYSYDRTISYLKTASKGAHEISLSFQLCNPKKRKTKLVLIACPKF